MGQQTTANVAQTAAFAGMLADLDNCDIRTYVNEEATDEMEFGIMLGQGTLDSDALKLTGSYSFVDDNFFEDLKFKDGSGSADIALNAPKQKFKLGASYLLSDLLSALLGAQLERISEIQEARCAIWQTYLEFLLPYHDAGRLFLGQVPETCTGNGHLFWFLARTPADRTRLAAGLRELGVDVRSHFIPLHLVPYPRRRWGVKRRLPVTEDVSERLLRLPLYPSLSNENVAYVLDALARVLKE